MKLDPQVAADVALLREEFSRHDTIMRAMAEPNSLEGAVAKAAFDRIGTFVADLQLDQSILEIAQQVCFPLAVLVLALPVSACRKPSLALPVTGKANKVQLLI